MYYYLYDSFLADKKYERVLAAVETRLTDLGISGKIGRLTAFTNARGLIRDEVRRGVQTVVVVGNDQTIAKVVGGIDDAKLTLGFIPVGTPTSIARSLGIPDGVEACDILSKRVTQKIDLGMVNGHLFLSQVRMPGANVTIEGEGKFRLTSLADDCDVVVSNLRISEHADPGAQGAAPAGYTVGDPMDGWLDALITPRPGAFMGMFRRAGEGARSVIPMRKLSVTSEEPIAVEADGRQFSHNVVSIEIVPDRLKVITGRERVFA
ncbi:MAG TPA: diacylglycerol kinase family protein [Candidatus Eisenbacteria bacterium]|nr:diacylglycerol kinase family protein [Candidatus Eisenbacteria bacterium]